MSMIRQLWLLVILVTLGTCAVTLASSLWSNRLYLEDQLRLKNHDNAAALAISLSQQGGEMSTIRLLISAQYDTGHYQRITLSDPAGNRLYELADRPPPVTAPAWFVAALPIASTPGVAQVSAGWQALGSVTVVSHSAFAHGQLWSGAVHLSALLALVGLLTGFCGTLLLRRVTAPLQALVAQASALSERRFIKSSPSSIPELGALAGAMNDMVDRVGAQFAEHAATVERLRQAAVIDGVTGVANRAEFQRRFNEALNSPAGGIGGLFLIVRVRELARLNQELGRSETDRRLARLGGELEAVAAEHSGALCGRLNGSDFALWLPAMPFDAETFARLRRRLRGFEATAAQAPDLAIGATRFRTSDDANHLLARADAALAVAEADSERFALSGDSDDEAEGKGQTGWRRDLQEAIARGQVVGRLRHALDREGRLLHRQFDLHVAWGRDDYRPPAEWLPFAIRTGLAPAIEEIGISRCLELAAGDTADIALPLCASSLRDGSTLARLVELLEHSPPAAARLIVEIPESLAYQDPEFGADLSKTLRRSGARLALFDAGSYVSRIPNLPELRLQHLRTAPALAAESGRARREHLAGVVAMCHGLGIRVILGTDNAAADLAASNADGAVSPGYGV
jgi:predicted signal transduction protein with EAL and GGDEF domain